MEKNNPSNVINMLDWLHGKGSQLECFTIEELETAGIRDLRRDCLENPYVKMVPFWFFCDDEGYEHGPYVDERESLHALLAHCAGRMGPPTLIERFVTWWKNRERG